MHRDIGDRLCLGDCDELGRDDLLSIIQAMAQPAPQPHPEPIAWMVGTAIWWTKEEAEKDAAAMGLPIVGLGPMSAIAPAEQHQGEPVAWLDKESGAICTAALKSVMGEGFEHPLYTRTDPGEVERLRDELDIVKNNDLKWQGLREQEAEIENLRAQLAKRDALLRESSVFFQAIAKKLNGFHDDNPGKWCGYLDDALGAAVWQQDKIDTALSASAEPSAPVEIDDAALIDALRTCEKWFVKHSPTAPLIGGFGDAEHPMLTCIRAALERKPS